MRTIKFRGKRTDTGKMVFGYFVRGGNKKPYILVDNPNNNGQSLYPVDPDSVAQLVGVDSAGNEVYEGDYVYVRTNSGGTTFKPATMIDIHLVNNYTLKGGDDNGGA